MEQQNKDTFNRWLFSMRDGHEITFSQKSMPYAVFADNAIWGGSCHIGDIKCRIRIRHNSNGEKGKRLEVWFPDFVLDKKVPLEESTLVGYIAIKGNFRDGTGKCIFRLLKGEDL